LEEELGTAANMAPDAETFPFEFAKIGTGCDPTPVGN